MNKKIALVTGARRGLGLATAQGLLAKGYEVVLAHRRLAEIPVLGVGAHERELDLVNAAAIEALAKELLAKFGGVDVLVNNAGIFVDGQTPEAMMDSFRTNTLAPALLSKALLPSMLRRGYGRIVNVSSGMGQLGEMASGYLAYRVSKTALNAVTAEFAAEIRDAGAKDVLVNSVCPGWVRTDMGGPQAPRSIEEGVAGILWAATLPEGGPNGGFFRDGKPLAW